MHIPLPSFGVESQLLVYSSQKMGPFASVVFVVAFYNIIPLETFFYLLVLSRIIVFATVAVILDLPKCCPCLDCRYLGNLRHLNGLLEGSTRGMIL